MSFWELRKYWSRFWMRYAGLGLFGRVATWLSERSGIRLKSLSQMNSMGYVASSASVRHDGLRLGRHCFIGRRVAIRKLINGGLIEISENVSIYDSTIINTAHDGNIKIGARTTINYRCILSAFKAQINIGEDVLIGPNCSFFPYDHCILPGTVIKKQPVETQGGINIGNDVWLGAGTTVLDGVTIGSGAVIGAGAVVSRNIPAGAVAVGVPARVIKMRSDIVADKECYEKNQNDYIDDSI